MSSTIFISVNEDDIRSIRNGLLLMDSEVPVAQARVINRTLSAINTEASIQVRKYYNLTATRVKKNFVIRNATKINLSGGWASTGNPIGLINFGARQNLKGVSVKVEATDARKTINHTFIRIGKNNNEHVFWREKRGDVVVGRYPINKLDGPRIEDALAKDDVQKALQSKADSTIQSRIEVETAYILSKAQ